MANQPNPPPGAPYDPAYPPAGSPYNPGQSGPAMQGAYGISPLVEDRTPAIVAYISLIGFIIAVVLYQNRKSELAAFHLRQALGLNLTMLAVSFGGWILAFIPFVGILGLLAILLGLAVIWVMGIISAINGTRAVVPVLGPSFQQWFAQAFR